MKLASETARETPDMDGLFECPSRDGLKSSPTRPTTRPRFDHAGPSFRRPFWRPWILQVIAALSSTFRTNVSENHRASFLTNAFQPTFENALPKVSTNDAANEGPEGRHYPQGLTTIPETALWMAPKQV
eukprot:CAMPEP_0184214636 /NCGR_PEP_ID=MMETSP0976-20121227/14755_1 /TAXON_ID=483370 /ORGANISM="non described non described, Strain CCMP2097" /LENGTH=128 /DNA_ID=CAMNT_0026519393 /DNA_START=99 /DNA_END=487 /DNA_ORIENTATION=-